MWQNRTWLFLGGFLGGAVLLAALATVYTSSNPGVLKLWSAGPAQEVELVPEAEPQPKLLVIGGANYDFGFLERGHKGKHTFVLKNVGFGPLRLKKGTTSCTCTSSELQATVLRPSESTEMTLEWESKNDNPEFRSSATVFTNDRDQQQVELAIHGKIIQLLTAVPDKLIMANSPAHVENTTRFTLCTAAVNEFTIEETSWTNPDLAKFFDVKFAVASAAALESAQAKSGYEVTVTLKPGLPLGQFQQKIRLRSSISNGTAAGAEVEVPIIGTVVGELSIQGAAGEWVPDAAMLRLGQVLRPAGIKRPLKLFIRGPNRDIEVESIEVKPSDVLKVTTGPRESLGKISVIPLEVEIPPGAPLGNYLGNAGQPLGEIVIHTNHPTTPELRIVVQFAVVEQ